MKKSLSLLSLVIALSMTNINSYIYKASQLRNPKTGQRVLLFSDIHKVQLDNK